MESHSTIFGGVLIEVFGTFIEADYEYGYKGGWLSNKIEVNGINITPLLSESTREQIDEQIAQEY